MAVTLLRPPPTVMRRHFRFGFFFIGNEYVSVITSTMVMCSPASGRASPIPTRAAPST
ncbi:Uncharacterised protein [Mycobacterium tuberculosis]|uniref:Uncharacterized protein n=1 Tax=Mycobacterium tuberculosis TaxID=1773 RepID=A0A0T7PRD4_MYCTX|nr:Uncharacterised protein [Mycobacterium tuberculosis]COV27703.1 Uncharacterised protein [Mycobacterium tuberculosis]COW82280.1 Uncharacterised protein [Mycobacterium tuberculosis]COX59676.1 Uncharacterised protein [Mycobacterium tuberculosis]COX92187.1 Uncharacterised protein [Mycobacterium tuberculosis]